MFCLLVAGGPAAGQTVFDQVTSKWTVEANGTAVSEAEFEIRAPRRNPLRIFSIPLTWSESIESLTIIQARIEKPDGRIVVLPDSAIRDDPFTGDKEFHEFSDERRLMLTFTNVEPGDVLVVKTRRSIVHPRIPGGFTVSPVLDIKGGWGDINDTVNVPSNMPFQIETRGFEHQSEVIIDRTVHYIRMTKSAAPPPGTAVLNAFDRVPRFTVSTFSDWDAFGHAYAGVFLPHAKVTPAIRALAVKLTEKEPETSGQARVLYEWVRDNVRHVAMPLERGRPEPNDAERVMTKRYGDDKDHVVVLMALLAARGIPSEIVLLNAGNSATISSVPAIAPMDHLILYLPGLDRYVDSTRRGALFGVLPFPELGKPAIHLGGAGPARRTIPIPPASETVSSLVTSAILDDDGTVSGTTTTTARGSFGLWLREAARAVGTGTEATAAATSLLLEHATPGDGTFAPDPLTSTSGPDYTLRGTFRIPNQSALLQGGYFGLWTGLRVLPRAGDFLAGTASPAAPAAGEATFCYPGTQREEISLIIPKGHALSSLPRDVDILGESIHYHSHWRLEDRRVTVTRVFESLVRGPVCDGGQRTGLAALLPEIRADMNNPIGFERIIAPEASPSARREGAAE